MQPQKKHPIKILIINNAEKGVPDFCVPIENILREATIHHTRTEYADTEGINRSQYHGFILSGSPCGNDIVQHHLPYFQWIKRSDKPILGICAGHHIIGKLFGARLLRSIEKEIGDFFITISRDDPIFNEFHEKLLVRQSHHDSITLPEGFLLLAYSEKCQVEAMKHQTLPIYSTQFHPEILNKKLILNFVDIVSQLFPTFPQ